MLDLDFEPSMPARIADDKTIRPKNRQKASKQDRKVPFLCPERDRSRAFADPETGTHGVSDGAESSFAAPNVAPKLHRGTLHPQLVPRVRDLDGRRAPGRSNPGFSAKLKVELAVPRAALSCSAARYQQRTHIIHTPETLPRSSHRRAKQEVAPGLHAAFFGAGAVIVAKEMQEAMGEELCRLGQDRGSPRTLRDGLSPGGFERDHDIPKESLGRLPAYGRDPERQDVGRAILLAIGAVERANRRIAAEENRKLGAFEPERTEHASSAQTKRPHLVR